MKKEGMLPAVSSPWGLLAASVAGSLIAATVGTFADEMIGWFKENKAKSKSKEYYVEMLKAHPSLKKQDPKIVAQYWASLFHFAPHMAADPLSSGAFIRQSIDRGYPDLYGGPPVDTYSTLAGIEKAVADAKPKGRGMGSEIGISVAGKVIGAQSLETLKAGVGTSESYENQKKQEAWNKKWASYTPETIKIAVKVITKG